MPETSKNIIEKDSNLISRNVPVALVVGAAGFLGSQLSEKILLKNIQVLGIDDFSTGKKENLNENVKNKNFHFINSDAGKIEVNTPRLDYIFIVSEGNWNLSRILYIAKEFKSKILFISTIELYDRNLPKEYIWFKEAESQIAKFATEEKLNARIVRLGPVFGPRMHFRVSDPMIRLIHASLQGEIQKESVALEFTTRALFVDDAVNLILKSILSGSTAQKIFDGVNSPVKIAEVKQILMDPLWHETRGFKPSELPPWPTPNLESTKKHLSWKPESDLVSGLRKTLHYFKEADIQIPVMEQEKMAETQDHIENPLQKIDNEFKNKVKEWKNEIDIEIKKPKSGGFSKQKITALILWLIIIYGIFYPLGEVLWHGAFFRLNISRSNDNLEKGKLGDSVTNVSNAKEDIRFISNLLTPFELSFKLGILNDTFEGFKKSMEIYERVLTSWEDGLAGSKELYSSYQKIGEGGDFKPSLEKAKVNLDASSNNLSKILLEYKNSENLPFIDIDRYLDLVNKNKLSARFLPGIVAEEEKSYIFLIVDDKDLIGSNGNVLVASRVDFKEGKFKGIKTIDANKLDKNLGISVEPVEFLKKDYNLKDAGIKFATYDADFPTSARAISWFYTKAEGMPIDGVLTIDLTALKELIEILEQNKPIPEDSEKLSKFTDDLLKKLFFLPDLNWLEITDWFSRNFESKHLQIYFADSKLFSFLTAEGFSGSIPRPASDNFDLLSVIESSISLNDSNLYLDKSYNLVTNIDKGGGVSHILKIGYINTNSSEIFKERIRIYLPSGTKLNKALWGEKDLLKDTTSFVEYGRIGYSFIFEVLSKEQKTLILEYTTPLKLNFSNDISKYRLNLIKQAGSKNDPLEWKLVYPGNLKIDGMSNIKTDFSRDRSFELEFKN